MAPRASGVTFRSMRVEAGCLMTRTARWRFDDCGMKHGMKRAKVCCTSNNTIGLSWPSIMRENTFDGEKG